MALYPPETASFLNRRRRCKKERGKKDEGGRKECDFRDEPISSFIFFPLSAYRRRSRGKRKGKKEKEERAGMTSRFRRQQPCFANRRSSPGGHSGASRYQGKKRKREKKDSIILVVRHRQEREMKKKKRGQLHKESQALAVQGVDHSYRPRGEVPETRRKKEMQFLPQ